MNACGDVAFERTMCSAVRRRMLENGTSWSPAVRNDAIDTGGADVAATRAGGGGGGGAAAGATGAA